MTSIANKDQAVDFEAHRRALMGLAYRMLGSRAEAEDVVQALICAGTASITRRSMSRAATSAPW
jgi:DNA-directed RNA polymerase specialized sigma24 family protein